MFTVGSGMGAEWGGGVREWGGCVGQHTGSEVGILRSRPRGNGALGQGSFCAVERDMAGGVGAPAGVEVVVRRGWCLCEWFRPDVLCGSQASD